MRFSKKSQWRSSTTRFVLILQSEHAFWFKIVNNQVQACHTEHIQIDCPENEVNSPWVDKSDSTDPLLVELILDTTLDEVDRVSVEPGTNTLLNRYSKYLTLARLRKDNNRANVYLLPGNGQDNIAAIMHPAIPEQWASWLLMLQTANLVFHRVVTGSELAAYRSRHLHYSGLLIMGVGDYERHMLVQQGVVQFLRTVHVDTGSSHSQTNDTDNSQSVVDQSIDYISSVFAKDADAVALVRPRCAATLEEEISGVFIDSGFTNDSVIAQVSILLAMLLEQDIEFHIMFGSKGVGAENASQGKSQLNSYPVIFQVIFKNSVSIWYNLISRLPIKKKLSVDLWPLQRSTFRWFSAFEPSVNYMSASRRLSVVFSVSLAFALIAMGAASVALINGVSSKRLIYKDNIQQAMIQDVETELYASAAGMSLQPMIAADSLYVADEILASVLITPEVLLEEVATAVTAVTGIQLDRLVWAQADGEELYESLTHTLDSVLSQPAVADDTTSSAVQLELSGIVSGETLKEQQYLLNVFVTELWQVPGARDARILESPVDNAMSSESRTSSGGQYRVSLILDAGK